MHVLESGNKQDIKYMFNCLLVYSFEQKVADTTRDALEIQITFSTIVQTWRVNCEMAVSASSVVDASTFLTSQSLFQVRLQRYSVIMFVS